MRARLGARALRESLVDSSADDSGRHIITGCRSYNT
jgi:hypothetical protein